MRLLAFLTFAAALLVPTVRASAAPAPTEVALEFVHLETSGVTDGESAAVVRAVTGVAGVRSAEWLTPAVEMRVVREVGKGADDALVAAAKQGGADTAGRVPLALSTFTFEKKLHCGGCVGAVNKALGLIKGVKNVAVNVEMTQVSVVYDTRVVKPADVESTLTSIGKPGKLTS